jgi:hypothetical protein
MVADLAGWGLSNSPEALPHTEAIREAHVELRLDGSTPDGTVLGFAEREVRIQRASSSARWS